MFWDDLGGLRGGNEGSCNGSLQPHHTLVEVILDDEKSATVPRVGM